MNIDFIFDFASPNAYLVHQAITPFKKRTSAQVIYIPCLLGGIFKSTNNQPPMIAFANIPAKVEYQNTEINRFIEKHKITKFKFNPHFPINTLKLMRAACVAERDGYLMDYIDVMLSCIWEQGLKMDETEVIQTAFQNAGFDAENLMQQSSKPEIKEKLIANTNAAVERGCFGIPTFYVENEMFFGKETLSQIETYITEERRHETT